ncbi:MAG TPA: cation:proton antiporter [Ghiorsea sp.]|nr:cation:proton antiporter [Ghiorsea sp.]HIP06896.1 cation:proton antiporter [Mariprofundaceae bacterium]
MESIFLSIGIILLSARILGELAARFKAPSVMGEMLAGIIIGPSLLGIVELNDIIYVLAEIGLILLLFEVGLDTDLSKLSQQRVKASVVALGGFIAPFLGGFVLSYWLFDLSLLVSMFIGGTLTATSIGVTVRVLRDLKRHKSSEAQVVIGAAVLDDILGIVLLALLYEFSTSGGINLINTGKVIVFIVIFMALAPIVAKIMAETIGKFSPQSQVPGLIPTTIVTLVLLFAWLAHAVGAPALLGGFAAGLALSRRFFLPFGAALQAQSNTDFVQRIHTSMMPIIQLFTPIFFVMVGLSLNLREIDWGSPTVMLMASSFIIIAMLSKLVGAFLIKESMAFRWAVGLSMIPRAEVGLVFAELGRISNVFNQEIYAVMVLTIAVTTVLPPFILKWFYKRWGKDLPKGSN